MATNNAINKKSASITFDGTNVLSNYVVATAWTPTISFSGGTTGITYTTQTGYYSRIGNIIYFVGYILLSSNGSDTGYVRINGLPTNSSQDSYGMSQLANTTYTGEGVCWKITSGTNYLALLTGSNAGANSLVLDESNISDTTKIIVSGFYFV